MGIKIFGDFLKEVKKLLDGNNYKRNILSYKISSQKCLNKKSKKIVYIGHSFHAKTKSTEFLKKYLSKYFEITEVLDHSWKGEKFPDYSFINNDYIGVIFFQTIPSPEILSKINNPNIIFFPMYDNHGMTPYSFWEMYKNIKIVSFSKNLFNKLQKWGHTVMYQQYFPKPTKDKKVKKINVFFWQRINSININTVDKLLNNTSAQVHIHKATDPGSTYLKPTPNQEKKYNITYSDWYATRESFHKKVKKYRIFIAPREYEGIGLTFLEIMSMGKVIISPNNPTMNEYITNNYNGYLYDLNNPKPINFKNIKFIEENISKFMQEGYNEWINNRKKIIRFIKK